MAQQGYYGPPLGDRSQLLDLGTIVADLVRAQAALEVKVAELTERVEVLEP